MENYKIIRDYLATFPRDFTVGTILSNIEKAEKEYYTVDHKYYKLPAYFYKEEADENGVLINKYLIGAYDSFIRQPCYKCNILRITDGMVCFDEAVTITEKELDTCQEINPRWFQDACDVLHSLYIFKPSYPTV